MTLCQGVLVVIVTVCRSKEGPVDISNQPITLSVASSATPPPSPPVLPGVAMCMERGIDLSSLSFQPSKIFEMTYADQQTLLYGPAESQSTYSVPDQMQALQQPDFSNHSLKTLMKDEHDYKDAYSIKTTDSASGVAWSGSGSGSLAYTGSLFTSSSDQYYLNFSVQSVYNFARGTDILLTQAFSEAINGLPTSLTASGAYDAYKTFFQQYGTHYALSGYCGGYIVMESDIETSLVKSASSTKIAAELKASYSGMIDSGSVDVSTMYSRSSFLSKYKSSITLSYNCCGGQLSNDIKTYCESVFASPILLLGPCGNEALVPTLAPLADLAPSAIKATMLDAMDRYLHVACLGSLHAIQYSNVSLANVEALVLGSIAIPGSGPRGTITGLTAGSQGALTPGQASGTAFASAHISSNDYSPVAAYLLPVRNGDYVNNIANTTCAAPAYSLYQANLTVPERLAPVFGAWQNLETLTGTWASDGFVLAGVQCPGDGERGSTLLTSGGNLAGACSAHYFYAGDNWYPQESFCVPVRNGDQYTVTLDPTCGAPTITCQFLPIQPQALAVGAAQLCYNGQSYTAETDGIFVVVMSTVDQYGGQASVTLAGTTEELATAPVLAATSVQMGSNPWLPYNTVAVPVRKGMAYQFDATAYQMILLLDPISMPIDQTPVTATGYFYPLVMPFDL